MKSLFAFSQKKHVVLKKFFKIDKTSCVVEVVKSGTHPKLVFIDHKLTKQKQHQMKMKTILPLSVITALLCMYGCSCGSTTDTYLGDFVYDYNAGGPTRTEGVSFTINNVPYITTGFNGSVNSATLGNNLLATWAYDTTVSSWIQKADFPGVYRYSAVAFAANGKGYV